MSDEWAGVSGRAVPHVCLTCREKPKAYYGRLVFATDTEEPRCPYHKERLIPIVGRVLDGHKAVQ